MTSSTVGERQRHSASNDAGFSLMEMMITTFLTMVVVAGALGALDDGLIMQENAGLSSEMNHNIWSAMNELTWDFLQAGQGMPLGGVPIPSGSGATPIKRPGPGSLTFPAGLQMLPSVHTGNALGPTLLGSPTDIVTILYVDTTLDLDQLPLADLDGSGSTMTVEGQIKIDQQGNALAVGDLIMFSNAMGNALQMITSIASKSTVVFSVDDPMDLNQWTATGGTILQLRDSPTSFPPTTATRVVMVTYYVDDSVPASPRLMRVLGNGAPRPIAMEIEGLQLTYDLVDGVTNPSGVDTPVAPNAEAEIRKANISIQARSYKTHRLTGEYQRGMLTTQVSLRSLSFFDRYQ